MFKVRGPELGDIKSIIMEVRSFFFFFFLKTFESYQEKILLRKSFTEIL